MLCAVYARKSSEEGLEQSFNSLDAQREACEAFVLSQKAQGWKVDRAYEDGGYSGGNVERPGLQQLLQDIRSRRIRIVVVYKVDRLTRSLGDFAKLVELFDAHEVSFVSVTQQFNITTSMGRLTLNVLLSFAQFEREVTGERIRDKIAASKKKGMWMGGFAPMGHVPHERTLVVDEPEAQRVREIFRLYLELRSVYAVKAELDQRGWKTPAKQGRRIGGNKAFTRGHLYRLLSNPVYVGRISHKKESYPGQHPGIVDLALFETVQASLVANAHDYEVRSDAAQTSPLAGIAFDAGGRRLKPTHATKRGKRYRYYFSSEESGSPALRIPAPELEDAAVRTALKLLNDERRLVDLVGCDNVAVVGARLANAREAVTALTIGSEAARLDALKRLVERVDITADAIRVQLDRDHLGWGEGDSLWTEQPAKLRRNGPTVRLVIQGGGQSPRKPDPRLIDLLAKAQQWFGQLKTGARPSVLALAEEHGMASAEVVRIVYLAFLAPDLVQKIVQGGQPEGLGVKRLLALAPLPPCWAEQRKALGFER